MNDKSRINENRNEKILSQARKRLAAIQGPSISFKRPRQRQSTTSSEGIASTSNGQTLENNTTAATNFTLSHVQKFNPISSPYGRCSNVSERYKKVARIGEGTYGIVYKAIDQQTQKIVALKRCLPHHQASDGFPITTLREIQILREISLSAQDDDHCEGDGDKDDHSKQSNSVKKSSHENIVSLLEVAVGSKSSSVFLVFEYAHFDLAKLIDEHYAKYSKSPFTLSETKCLTRQLFSAVGYLHERWIIHRDLKLSNLLYDKDRGILKLADFGLARKIKRGEQGGDVDGAKSQSRSNRRPWFPSTPPPILTPKVVSLWYRPPELLLNAESYTMAIDQWAAGCIIAELLLGQPLFRGKNDLDQLNKIMDILGAPLVNDWPGLLEMPLVKSGSVELPFSLAAESTSNSQALLGPSIGRYSGKRLLDIFSNLTVGGIEILTKLLMYDPAGRWTANQASDCSWLKEYPHPTQPAYMPKFETKM